MNLASDDATTAVVLGANVAVAASVALPAASALAPPPPIHPGQSHHSSICNLVDGKEEEDARLAPTDLLSFCRQIASGMVRNKLNLYIYI